MTWRPVTMGIACMLAFLMVSLTVPVLAAPLVGTIDYAVWGDAKTAAIEQQVIAAFQAKHPQVKVNLLYFPYDDYLDKLTTMMVGGTPPDVALVDGYWYQELAAFGYLTDVTNWAEKDGVVADLKKNLQPAYFDQLYYNGRLYSVASLRSGALVHYYNNDMFRTAGLVTPVESKAWTWDSMLAALKKLTLDKNGDSRPDQYGINVGRKEFFWYWVWMNGGEILNKDNTQSPMDEPAAIQAIQWLADLSLVHNVNGGDFVNGTAAMTDTWISGGIRTWRDVIKFDWDIAPPPAGKVGSISVGAGNEIVIPANANNKEIAWEFMKFLGGEEANYIYGVNRAFVPPYRRAAQRVIQEWLKAKAKPANIMTVLDMNARALPTPPGFENLVKMWGQELTPVYQGTRSAAEAGTRIAQLSTSILEQARQKVTAKKK